ncbi:MAG: hypothetical protein QM820_33730 [Minicystis sp.]
MRHRSVVLRVGAALVSGALLAACGGGDQGSAYACDNSSLESRCFDYWSDATKSDVSASCDGAVIEGPCPRAQAVGTCSLIGENGPSQGKTFIAIYYADGPMPWTAEGAEANCDASGGTFAAP